MKEFSLYMWIALIALMVGGVNYAFMGLFNINLISAILGALLGRLIFLGIAGAAGYFGYLIYLLKFKKA